MAKSTAATVTASELAKIFRLKSARRIQQLVKEEGMPKASRGRYDRERCVSWYIGYLQDCLERRDAKRDREPTPAEAAAARRALADAQMSEAKLAMLRRDWLPRGEVQLELRSFAHRVRDIIEAFPYKHAHRAVGLPDLNAATMALRSVAAGIVQSLYTMRLADQPAIERSEETAA